MTRSNLDWNNPNAISIVSLFQQLGRHSKKMDPPGRSEQRRKAGSYKKPLAKKGRRGHLAESE